METINNHKKNRNFIFITQINSGASECSAANPGFMNSDDAANRAMVYLKLLADIFLTLWWKTSIDILYQS